MNQYNGVPRTPAYSVITDTVFRRNGYRDRGLFFLCHALRSCCPSESSEQHHQQTTNRSTKVLTQSLLIAFRDPRSACDVIVSYLLWFKSLYKLLFSQEKHITLYAFTPRIRDLLLARKCWGYAHAQCGLETPCDISWLRPCLLW